MIEPLFPQKLLNKSCEIPVYKNGKNRLVSVICILYIHPQYLIPHSIIKYFVQVPTSVGKVFFNLTFSQVFLAIIQPGTSVSWCYFVFQAKNTKMWLTKNFPRLSSLLSLFSNLPQVQRIFGGKYIHILSFHHFILVFISVFV